jgi:outer membrane protein assembly factor BamE
MRRILIPVLLLSLVAGCSSFKIGPHRIDVQQGNALDQENVARLKPGLSRSQVRFLLGTPLLVDPFRSDRWDYVYRYYKAGTLTEQKRITLFFDGDTLARIEGDLPPPVAQPAAPASVSKPEPQAAPAATPAAPVVAGSAPAAAATAVQPVVPQVGGTPQPSAELRLQADTNVARIQPDVIPAFPQGQPAPDAGSDQVVKALNAWADAWSRRDPEAYLAAYDAAFVPQDGGSRADWEARKRKVLSAAKRIEVRIASPAVERTTDGSATVTFRQSYRSDSYRDSVLKQVRMIERDGRWLIVEEKVLPAAPGNRP